MESKYLIRAINENSTVTKLAFMNSTVLVVGAIQAIRIAMLREKATNSEDFMNAVARLDHVMIPDIGVPVPPLLAVPIFLTISGGLGCVALLFANKLAGRFYGYKSEDFFEGELEEIRDHVGLISCDNWIVACWRTFQWLTPFVVFEITFPSARMTWLLPLFAAVPWMAVFVNTLHLRAENVSRQYFASYLAFPVHVVRFFCRPSRL